MTNEMNVSSLFRTANQSNNTMRTPSPTIGKDAFLQILMKQLQMQDPLSPLEDKDFIAQMATFSSLEQLTNMSETMESFLLTGVQQNWLAYTNWIGKKVTYRTDEKSEVTNEGIVKSVTFANGEVQLQFEDGTTVSPLLVTKVENN